MKNPFEFGRELDAEELVDRDDEVRAVVSAVMEAGKLFLIGPRRYGKTSILHVASERATRSGALVFRYNAEAFPTLEQLAARIVADTASQLTPTLEKAAHGITSFFSRVRPTASYDSVRHTWSVSFGRGPDQPVGVPLLAEVLDGADRAAEKAGRAVGILFDEFQHIVEEGGAEAEGQIRSAVQRHRHVGYVFAGSHTRLLADMTSAPNRPFYKLGLVRSIGPVPRDEFAQFLERGFLKAGIPLGAGAVDAILDTAEEVPYNVQLLAHACWDACREDGSRRPAALTVERVHATARVAAVRNDPLYTQLWTSLPVTQRKALLALLRERGQGMASADVALRYDIPVASMQTALRALEQKTIVREEHHRGSTRLRLEDPLFGTWLASVVPV
jgi:hypothetical protein